TESAEAAAAYFAGLWRRTSAEWRAGAVAPARMVDGATIPVDYCVSTIARLAAQPGGPLAAVQQVQAALAAACPGQFLYPAGSLHVSLLGCTPRVPSPDAFGAEKIRRIHDLCARVLARRGPVTLALRGVGVQGCQVFVQAIPGDDAWARLRQALEDALVAAGEAPIAYPDKRPIHLNVLRMTDASPATLDRMLAAVEALLDAPLGELTVAWVELVVTDFVVSPRHVRTLATFELA
ncbi:MAG: 2'-5' RNA ligase family protein, partial [Chloroflexota bacterium]|nr:2'-5' RNA ligase family protein [Chloroflexota bacterium]